MINVVTMGNAANEETKIYTTQYQKRRCVEVSSLSTQQHKLSVRDKMYIIGSVYTRFNCVLVATICQLLIFPSLVIRLTFIKSWQPDRDSKKIFINRDLADGAVTWRSFIRKKERKLDTDFLLVD